MSNVDKAELRASPESIETGRVGAAADMRIHRAAQASRL